MPYYDIKRVIFVETALLSLLCTMDNRKKRDDIRNMGKGYYHFCTDGLKGGKLFYTSAQFAYGMILIGLITLKFNIKVYAFVLMPNHIHIILSGTGENCLKAFDYLRKKISIRLIQDGYPPLPPDYGFVLVPITEPHRMKSEIAYVLRNPLEKNISIPYGYPWGSGWLYHSAMACYYNGTPVSDMSKREVKRLFTTCDIIPPHWEYSQERGLNPAGFVDLSLTDRLFPTPKDMESFIVKDYESYVRIANDLGETMEFSPSEIKDIVTSVLQSKFGGRSLNNLSEDEKCKLAVELANTYNLSSFEISRSIFLKEHIVRQVLYSKDYR
jgi:REP element-mobilizing transposase RayT